MLKIDIYNHVFPQGYWELMLKVAGDFKDMGKRVREIPMLTDLDERLRVMDMFGEDYRQILSLASPPLEVLASPDDAADLAKAANDGMASLVDQHPERFPGFVASLAMNNAEAMMSETHRAIRELGAVGVQIFTNVNGKPLDLPEYFPLFEAMAEYDLPIWVHPARGAGMPDYLSEQKSAYEIWWTLGWPYETSVFMARMVFSKVLQKLPNLKLITHHLGGMVPYFEGRVGPGWDQLGKRTSDEDYSKILTELDKPHLEYFKDFYADTAVFGSTSATKCGLDFFGVDKVVFASDAPFDPEKGPMYIRETIRVLDELGLPEADLAKIYHGNAQRLLRLPTN